MARKDGKDRGVLCLDGVWYARFYVDGKEVREKADNKTQAKALYGKRKAEIREGKYFPKQKTVRGPFRELAAEYLRYADLHHKRAGDDIPRVQTWLDAFGATPAEDVKPSQVEEVMATLKTRGMEPATIARRLVVLKAIYNRAVREGEISRNPVSRVQPPKFDNRIVRYLTPDEESRLFSALPEKLHPLVTIALHTGCRQGELLRLIWGDVDFESRTILVREAKSGESRRVVMNSRVLATLSALAGKENPSGPVFANTLGKPLDGGNLRREFEWAVRKAGIAPFRFHDLRHTFASRLAMNGANDRTLQTLLGHKSQAMILRYAHLGPSHLQAAVEGLVTPKLQLVDDRPSTGTKQVEWKG